MVPHPISAPDVYGVTCPQCGWCLFKEYAILDIRTLLRQHHPSEGTYLHVHVRCKYCINFFLKFSNSNYLAEVCEIVFYQQRSSCMYAINGNGLNVQVVC